MTIRARYYKTQDTDEREACLIDPPRFLIGQKVRLRPMFGGRSFDTEVTSVYLRTTVAPRWQYTVRGGGMCEPFPGTSWERHYEQIELEALTPEEDGPTGDGALEYDALMKAATRMDLSRIIYDLAQECRDLIDNMKPAEDKESQEAHERLWNKICNLNDEARILSEDLEYRSPEPYRKPNVFAMIGGEYVGIGHTSGITFTVEKGSAKGR